MLVNKFHALIHKLTESPLAGVFSIITVIVTLWGVVSIYKDLASWAGSKSAAFVIAILLGLLVLFVLASLLIPSVYRQYSLPFGERYILLETHRKCDLDETGNAIISSARTYLFFAEPNEIDLSDTVFAAGDTQIDDLAYNSSDSIRVDYEQISDNIRRIFWRPKGDEIKIGSPYTHHVRTSFPNTRQQQPPHTVMPIVATVFTLHYSLEVNSKIPIEDALVYRGSKFQKFKDEDEIARRGKTIRRRGAPLPNIIDAYNITWEVSNIPAGTTYYVVLYFNNS
jgi:hypothetical protein